MPKSMFQTFVCEPGRSTRKWYTLPLSLIAHVVLLATLIVSPLVATDVLPAPRSVLAFIKASLPPSPPPSSTSAQPREVVKRLQTQINTTAAPLEAPFGIGRESAIDLDLEQTSGIDILGLQDGIGIVPGGEIEAPPPPPPPPPPAPPQPIRVGGQIKAPTRVKDVAPVYPTIAQAARVEGDVIIEAVIGPDGSVQNARVLRSVGLLDQAALDAVQMWEYSPTMLNGQAVPVIVTVTVRFRLR
jgi:protein TonB